MRRYGNRVINDLVSFSKGEGELQQNDIVRLLRYKAGTVGAPTWNTSTKTATSNWTDQKYRVVRVHPGGRMRRETYSIASLATPNNTKAGRFSREQ